MKLTMLKIEGRCWEQAADAITVPKEVAVSGDRTIRGFGFLMKK
jgi:hypothetical protein